jgi:hypothetical protein
MSVHFRYKKYFIWETNLEANALGHKCTYTYEGRVPDSGVGRLEDSQDPHMAAAMQVNHQHQPLSPSVTSPNVRTVFIAINSSFQGVGWDMHRRALTSFGRTRLTSTIATTALWHQSSDSSPAPLDIRSSAYASRVRSSQRLLDGLHPRRTGAPSTS